MRVLAQPLINMLNPDDFTNEVTPKSRKWIGIICVLISFYFAGSALITKDIVYISLVIIAGLPLFLVGISLLFGKASKDQGIFSPFTLYLIGTLVGLGSIAGAISGEPKTSIGVIIAIGCFMLAKKRRNNIKKQT